MFHMNMVNEPYRMVRLQCNPHTLQIFSQIFAEFAICITKYFNFAAEFAIFGKFAILMFLTSSFIGNLVVTSNPFFFQKAEFCIRISKFYCRILLQNLHSIIAEFAPFCCRSLRGVNTVVHWWLSLDEIIFYSLLINIFEDTCNVWRVVMIENMHTKSQF